MRDINSLEIGVAVHELRQYVDNSRLRKFYDLGNGAFKFAFYKSNATTLVYVKLLKTINVTQYTETAEEATPFAMGIRKRLDNSVVDSIEQKNGDRIVVLNLDKGKYRIIIEMYGKGNVFVVNADGIIELCYKKVVQKERELKAGSKYEFPTNAAQNLLTLNPISAAVLVEQLKLDKSLINALSTKLGIGPLYLEDLIKKTGLEPMAKSLNTYERERLASQILDFAKRLKYEKPRLYLKNGVIEDYALCDLDKYASMEKKEFETLSAMLDEMYVRERTALPNTERTERLKELNINIEKQVELADKIVKDAEVFARNGHLLMSHMVAVNALNEYLRANKRATLEDVKAQFPALHVKALDLKNKTVTISIGE